MLDRKTPGLAAEASRQRDQLTRDLATLDEKRRPRMRSQITRQYQTLFSGVAATVDSAVINEIRQLPNVAAVYDDAEVHATFIPASLTLQDGESANVTLRLQVDGAAIPAPPEPLDFGTRIAVSNGNQTAHVPAYFFRGSVLALTFDEPPGYVDLVSKSIIRVFQDTVGTSLSLVVKSGTWDVVAGYVWPFATVVREQQNVLGRLDLNLQRGEATHIVSARPVDDSGQPLRASDHVRTLAIGVNAFDTTGLPSGVISTFGPIDFRVSDLSSRYLLAFLAAGSDPAGLRYFVSGAAGNGLSSDVVLPKTGVPYRRLAQAGRPLPEAKTAYLFPAVGWAVKLSRGTTSSVMGVAIAGELSRTHYLQWDVAPGLRILPIEQSILWGFNGPISTDFIDGPFLNFLDPANIGVDRYSFFNLNDTTRQPEIVLGPDIERWDVDVPPYALPMQFQNSPSTIAAKYNADFPGWMTHTMSRLVLMSNSSPTFDLYRGGNLAGTFALSTLQTPISSAAGAQEVHASLGYVIGGVAGSSQVVASFDTSKPDRNPPIVSRFHIEQGGIRTSTPFFPFKKPTTVKFRATDLIDVPSVSLEWRLNGTTTWTPLPLAGEQPDYEAPINQGGSIDLRVTATDSSGNSFQETWSPALVTRTARPPDVPTSVAATRTGASRISVSWVAPASDAGIAGYRIERVSGGQTFTTSGAGTNFDDTEGLVSGSAYFYRVIAIDTEDAVSTPSAYDVASLVAFEDDPVSPMHTVIRGVHVADLRLAVDAVRIAAGLGRTWADYGPLTGIARATPFLELRDRLNEARARMNLPAVNFLDPVELGAIIRARSVQQLRDGVK